MQSVTQQGSQSLRIARKYVRVGVIVYFVIVPVVSSIAISHVWAVGNADVTFFLPYISDSGGDPPQSAVFGFGLTTAAIAAIVTFSLRYVTVMDISKAKNMPGYILLLNYFNFLAGIGIFFGLLLVAMNPTGHLRRDGTWLSPIFIPHVVGASVLFVSGLSYMLINALLTFCLVDQYRNHGVFKARMVIFAFDLVACALTAAKYPNDLLTMKPHPTNPREYPEGTIISIIAEWLMLATFMGYIYTMKSELDATVVVIGIQKQLLRADDSQNSTAPPQFFSSATSGKVPDAPNLPKKLNGSVGQGGLEAACPSSHASTDNGALSRETGGNGRPGSSLPSALQLKQIPGKGPMVLLQKPSEHGSSRPLGLSSSSRCVRTDPAQACGAATLSGGREIVGSRQSSLAPRSNSAISKVGTSGLPKATGARRAVIPSMPSRDSSSSGVKKDRSPSTGASTSRKKGLSQQSSYQERPARPSPGRSNNCGEVSSRTSSRHASGPPTPQGRPAVALN